jgi:hypothetical protein
MINDPHYKVYRVGSGGLFKEVADYTAGELDGNEKYLGAIKKAVKELGKHGLYMSMYFEADKSYDGYIYDVVEPEISFEFIKVTPNR